MIKVFGLTDTTYTTNGDVVLQPLKAKVTKKDNGEYYLNLETGLEYLDFITQGRIVTANTPTGNQAFRIGNVVRTKNKISAKCNHVFYDTRNYLIESATITDANCDTALDILNSATEPQSAFTTLSDIASTYSYSCEKKTLYDAINDVLGIYGGHLVRDNFSIAVRESIETDNGLIVRYRKNLKDISCSENWDSVVTKLLPVGKDGIMLNTLDVSASAYVTSSTQYDIPYTKTLSFEQNISEDDYPTETEYKQAVIDDLRIKAQAYVNENCYPKVNYTLKANLEKLSDIGDVIQVKDERLGINITTNVIGFTYDCIADRYSEIIFGNFAETISGFYSTIQKMVDKTPGSTGGTTDYADLSNKPQINGVTLSGNKTTADLSLFSGNYDDLTNKPTIPTALSELTADSTHRVVTDTQITTWNGKSDFSGSYNDLTNKPTIPDELADLTSDATHRVVTDTQISTWNNKSDFSGSYNDLTDTPTIPSALSELTSDATHRVVTDTQISAWNGKSDFSGSYNDLTNKPTIPSALSELSEDSTHRVVTDAEKITWNNKSDFSGSYNDLTNKPTIPDELADLTADATHRTVTDAQITTWNNKSDFSGSYSDLTNKPTIPSALADLTADSTHRVVTDTQISTWNGKSDFSGNYSDLTDKPQINGVTLSSNKTTAQLIPIGTGLSINSDGELIATGGGGGGDDGTWTSTVTCQIGATTATITSSAITTTSAIDDYCENASGTKIAVESIVVTAGQAVLTFEALTEATTFRLYVRTIADSESGTWASASCSIGDTSATISNNAIKTTSVIDDYSETASGDKVAVDSIVVTAGQAVLSFDALTEATNFKIFIMNPT